MDVKFPVRVTDIIYAKMKKDGCRKGKEWMRRWVRGWISGKDVKLPMYVRVTYII